MTGFARTHPPRPYPKFGDRGHKNLSTRECSFICRMRTSVPRIKTTSAPKLAIGAVARKSVHAIANSKPRNCCVARARHLPLARSDTTIDLAFARNDVFTGLSGSTHRLRFVFATRVGWDGCDATAEFRNRRDLTQLIINAFGEHRIGASVPRTVHRTVAPLLWRQEVKVSHEPLGPCLVDFTPSIMAARPNHQKTEDTIENQSIDCLPPDTPVFVRIAHRPKLEWHPRPLPRHRLRPWHRRGNSKSYDVVPYGECIDLRKRFFGRQHSGIQAGTSTRVRSGRSITLSAGTFRIDTPAA